MKLLSLFIFTFYTQFALASFPELFGASFSTAFIGNQANLNANDPSNNYYVPAALAFSDKVNFLIQATATVTHFKSIDGIVVTNGTNSNSASTTGSVDTHYPTFNGGAMHLSLPVGYEHMGTVGLSLFLPIDHLIDTNSGDPFLPEYVMFHSRYQRTSLFLNFARKYSDDLAWSLGALLGYQAAADVKTNLSLNGSAYGSWGKARSTITPSLGIITSLLKRIDLSQFYFTYQQEMKSNLHAVVSGEINNPSLALSNSGIDSMIFYDPHTFRLGGSHSFDSSEIFASVEYQMWTGYKPPTIYITKIGGVIVPSSNFEHLKIRDTINPRLGFKVNLTNRWTTGIGIVYRMSPIKGNFSGSGNSLDANTTILTTGLQYRIVIWSKDVILGTSLEYHKLDSLHVVKSNGQEDGTAGSKIGAGGYDVGGNILSAGLGVRFHF